MEPLKVLLGLASSDEASCSAPTKASSAAAPTEASSPAGTRKVFEEKENTEECCAGEMCQMKGTPLNKSFHKCKTCKKRMHGTFCSALDLEDGNMWCLKCGSPENVPAEESSPAAGEQDKKKPAISKEDDLKILQYFQTQLEVDDYDAHRALFTFGTNGHFDDIHISWLELKTQLLAIKTKWPDQRDRTDKLLSSLQERFLEVKEKEFTPHPPAGSTTVSSESENDIEGLGKDVIPPLKKRKISELNDQQPNDQQPKKRMALRSHSRSSPRSSRMKLPTRNDRPKRLSAVLTGRKETTSPENIYARRYSNNHRKDPIVPEAKRAKTKAQTKKKAQRKTTTAKVVINQADHQRVESSMIANARAKNGKNRRSVRSSPYSVSCMKDRTVRGKFEACASHMAKLHTCGTMSNMKAVEYHPKSQHFMYTYDELVTKPHYAPDSMNKREEAIHVFLTPRGVDEKEFGQRLTKVGREMSKGSGRGYHLTQDQDKYHALVFGEGMQTRKRR
mmetsp:Transcript_8425/g.20724  ORF Transcript_8425/g.20724 Transcript_8425/m.20724 type:complete len:504 (-) Transcript_8425:69-1580(-)|eukprot:CAMPEP_0116086250 /NCGR_PEP_ID=MMETSP0327-20121206/4755_1 /TAXON_ID=44447 /ORGANISM="Pseudo-nitzschia delicatissima, Strain B596" /LENGTH=503 /DNA_ID=CAMNT_0003577289 /DNA_START=221 /DNA_END=1735 /DNA_ORIENTATION=+